MFAYIRYIAELSEAVVQRDPATHSKWQAYWFSPGVRALSYHYRAHKHFLKKRFFLANMISKRARKKTGIEIHPGATIGKRVVIDHGMGIVVGETAVIGDDVLMYHGVTLGATGNSDQGKRHPTIDDHVIIGAGSSILGDVVVGKHARIGATSVVLKDVPPYATAVGIPAVIKMKR